MAASPVSHFSTDGTKLSQRVLIYTLRDPVEKLCWYVQERGPGGGGGGGALFDMLNSIYSSKNVHVDVQVE